MTFSDTAATGGDEIDIDLTTLGVTFQYFDIPAQHFKVKYFFTFNKVALILLLCI